VKQTIVKKNRFRNFYLFLAVLGPGIITACADNDAGGIATYSLAGANFGYKILWTVTLSTFLLLIVQEMAARMAIVTGKGLSDLIRENFGLRWTVIIMGLLFFANLGTTIAEFAGIAAGGEILGVSRYILVPISAFMIWLLVVKGSFKMVERFFLTLCLIYFTYIISGFLANPDWGLVLKYSFKPYLSFNPSFLLVSIAVIGTTVTPWMQFLLQSLVVDKGISKSRLNLERFDLLFGAVITFVVAFFIVVSCAATLNKWGIKINSVDQAAIALMPVAGKFSGILFSLGLFGASTLAASILPLSSAYAICEAFGWESGLDKKWSEASLFFSLYTAFILIGAGFVLIPSLPLITTMLISQEINGFLLPVILIFMFLLINNKRLMKNYTNPLWLNIITLSAISGLIILSLLLVFSIFF
jgi:Mn2+/Fe2+ NRAMP family transporter